MMSFMEARSLDLVFAGLQRAALAMQVTQRAVLENAGIADDAVTLQALRDFLHAHALTHHEMGVGLQRTGLLEGGDHVIEACNGDDAECDDHRHHEIQEDDDLTARLLGAARRLGYSFGLQSLVWATSE